MSRIERLREYAKPTRREDWRGASRDQSNIDRWSTRASENSDGADHRATGTERAEAHSTGKRVDLRSTKAEPRTSAEIDARMAGKNDRNSSDTSPYLPGIRREA
jgi:hypothetical protein